MKIAVIGGIRLIGAKLVKNLRERAPAAWLLIRRIPRAQAPKGEAAFVYGAGADFKLSRQIFVLAE